MLPTCAIVILLSAVNTEKKYASIAFAIALPALIYVHYRALTLDFTYDECWTFLGYATQAFHEIVSNQFPAANNHILHSLLMKCSHALFGNAEYVLRLPVLIAFMLYIPLCFRLSKILTGEYWWGLFIALVYQPYLLDYFTMARGYGIALTAMLTAILALTRFINEKSWKFAAGALLAAAVSAYANFSYLLFFIALSIVILWRAISMQAIKKAMGMVATFWLLLTLISYRPLHQLIESKELYYGGREGLLADTMPSLVHIISYGNLEGRFWSLALFGLLAWIILHALWSMRKMESKYFTKISGAILGIWLMGTILQHIILDSPWPVERTAMFMIPLLLLALGQFITAFSIQIRGAMMAAMSIASLFNCAISANFTHFLDFREYADTKKAMQLIKNDTPNATAPFLIGKSVYMNATINYYKLRLDMPYVMQSGLEFCANDGTHKPYYYLFAKDTNCLTGMDVREIKHFEVSDTYLYKAQ